MNVCRGVNLLNFFLTKHVAEIIESIRNFLSRKASPLTCEHRELTDLETEGYISRHYSLHFNKTAA